MVCRFLPHAGGICHSKAQGKEPWQGSGPTAMVIGAASWKQFGSKSSMAHRRVSTVVSTGETLTVALGEDIRKNHHPCGDGHRRCVILWGEGWMEDSVRISLASDGRWSMDGELGRHPNRSVGVGEMSLRDSATPPGRECNNQGVAAAGCCWLPLACCNLLVAAGYPYKRTRATRHETRAFVFLHFSACRPRQATSFSCRVKERRALPAHTRLTETNSGSLHEPFLRLRWRRAF